MGLFISSARSRTSCSPLETRKVPQNPVSVLSASIQTWCHRKTPGRIRETVPWPISKNKLLSWGRELKKTPSSTRGNTRLKPWALDFSMSAPPAMISFIVSRWPRSHARSRAVLPAVVAAPGDAPRSISTCAPAAISRHCVYVRRERSVLNFPFRATRLANTKTLFPAGENRVPPFGVHVCARFLLIVWRQMPPDPAGGGEQRWDGGTGVRVWSDATPRNCPVFLTEKSAILSVFARVSSP